MNKLIRSKIDEWFNRHDVRYKISNLKDDAVFLQALKEKLVEEAQEVLETQSNKELIDELSDLYEVMISIIKTKNINWRKIKRVAAKKSRVKGNFLDKRLFCEYIEISDSNPVLQYYLNNKQYTEEQLSI